MIQEKTVLILGAGASKPYDFPLGGELLDEVKGGISKESANLFRRLKELNHAPSFIENFYDNLVYADPLSIDAFLEHRDEFLPIGKLAIAYCLIPRENKDLLFKRGKGLGPSWYQYLFNKLKASSPDEFGNNQLAIITFNYDRSIEYYLFTVLQHTYKLSDEKCANILERIPIIHVHGSLGLMPWQGKPSRPYGPLKFNAHGAFITNDELLNASKQIMVISEDIDTSPEFDIAYEEMENATKIIFLGFGYHEMNLKRLRINAIANIPNIQVLGTSLGMGISDLNTIRSKWKIQFMKPFKNQKIYDFLRDEVVLN